MAHIVSASGRRICRYSSPFLSSAAHQANDPFNRPWEGGNLSKEDDAVKLDAGSFPPIAAPRG